jgi:uncharacterized membrane protein YeiH
VDTSSPLFLALDLAGVFAFALNGGLTAIRVARLDVVGVLTLGMITALGGGIVRDVFIDALPPATFSDWRYLSVAAAGGLVVFLLGHRLDRWYDSINLLDAAGLSLFAVSGALKVMQYGGGPAQAVILGAVTAVGGGTIRDVMIGRVPVVLRSELYAVPALAGALVMVLGVEAGLPAGPCALSGALVSFAVRLVGVHYGLGVPAPRHAAPMHQQPDSDPPTTR